MTNKDYDAARYAILSGMYGMLYHSLQDFIWF